MQKDWKKSWVILPHISRRKKSVTFYHHSRRRRGRQNFFLIFVNPIPELWLGLRPRLGLRPSFARKEPYFPTVLESNKHRNATFQIKWRIFPEFCTSKSAHLNYIFSISTEDKAANESAYESWDLGQQVTNFTFSIRSKMN